MIDRTTDNLARRLERAAKIIPEIRQHIDEQRRLVPHITAQATDSSGGSGGGTHSDPTGRTMMELDRLHRLAGNIDDAVTILGIGVNVLESACRMALGHRTPLGAEDKPRCIGDNTPEGASCWNIPSPRRSAKSETIDDGRCHTCGPRYDTRKRLESDARRHRRHAEPIPAKETT